MTKPINGKHSELLTKARVGLYLRKPRLSVEESLVGAFRGILLDAPAPDLPGAAQDPDRLRIAASR